MVIAFPTNNQTTIANHIGLAKGFLIVDTSTNEKFYIQNPVLEKIQQDNINLKNTEEGHRGLGTGRVIPPLLAEAGVDILVARDFGEGMIRNLEDFEIRTYETDKKDIEEVLKEINENTIKTNKFRNNEFDEKYGYGRKFRYHKNRCFKKGFGFNREFRHRKNSNNRGFGCGRGFGFRRGLREWED